ALVQTVFGIARFDSYALLGEDRAVVDSIGNHYYASAGLRGSGRERIAYAVSTRKLRQIRRVGVDDPRAVFRDEGCWQQPHQPTKHNEIRRKGGERGRKGIAPRLTTGVITVVHYEVGNA